MSRGLSSGIVTAITSGAARHVHLLELTYWTGSSESVVRLTDAGHDLTADVGAGDVTFTGAGDLLSPGRVRETTDQAGQGTRLALSGVDQGVTAILLSNHFRNRLCRIWRAWIDLSDGTIIDSPYLVFRGRQTSEYSWKEERNEDGDSLGTVEIETRVASLLADLEPAKPVLSNMTSHNAMLDRAGLGTAGTDTFWQGVPALAGGRVVWKGGDDPADPADDPEYQRNDQNFGR